MNSGMDNARFIPDDKLNRKNQAVKISRILKNSENYSRPGEGLVVALNSAWGTGKTMFLKMWENEIKNNGLEEEFPLVGDKTKVIYCNAWEHDSCNNVMIPVVTHLTKTLERILVSEYLKEDKLEKLCKLLKEWRDISLNLINYKLENVEGKGISDKDIDYLKTYSKTDFNKFLEIEQSIDKKRGTLINDFGSDKYKKIADIVYPELFSGFEDFEKIKCNFKEILKEVSCNKKLIVFLDELDRCRPSYAIEMLEAIKHFLSIPNMVVVISVDIEQLSHSIATVYGQNMDSEGYLRRFIDLQFSLPTPKVQEFCNYLNTKNIDSTFFKETKLNIIISIFDELRLSLREMEKVFKSIIIFWNLFDETFRESDKCFEFYCFMYVLKYKDWDKYNRIMKDDMDMNKAIQIFNNSRIYSFMTPLLGGKNNKKIKELIEDNKLKESIYNQTIDLTLFNVENIKSKIKVSEFIESVDLESFATYDLTFGQYVERQLEFVFAE